MNDHSLEAFSRVVDSIYAAALEPRNWPQAVEGIARLHASPKANFLTPTSAPAEGGFIFPYGLTEDMLQTWDAKFRGDDVWMQAATNRGVIANGRVLLTDDLMTRAEFTESRHYREFLKDIDIADICTSVVFDGTESGTLPAVLSVFRGHASDPFDERSRQLHSMLTAHVSRALGVMFRLRLADLQIASSLAALNRLATGIMLIGDLGQVVFANRIAESTLKGGASGLTLRSGHSPSGGLGWLAAESGADDATLQREIASAVSSALQVTHFSKGISIRRSDGRRPIVVQLSNLAPGNEFSNAGRGAAAIAFISDPEVSLRLEESLLASAFGLTPAECVLAQELLSGDSIKQISGRLGLRPSTVNAQLDSIFAKTGIHRQSQLVRLLLSFVSAG